MSTKMDVMTGSTTSYLWLLRDLLGQGATASVYKARHKRSGELVAVKVFNATSYNRPQDVQLREFDMLRKLNHNNIIRILTVEDSNLPPPSSQKVLVMEYCAGGSLMNVLDEPANVCGLAEPEFLTVLQCVVLGMNHLRENGVVHRDIKPGNIMRQVMEDGSSVYKLTDFGAARELEDDEKFKSIYGTEEYLHPDMYARAMLRKRDEKSFGANVDLWSIGVTLYHTATGSLPFMPYGGPRKDKPTMFKITSEKPTGAIAGVQRSQGGPIKWSYELPHSCRLSQGLRQQLVPVLAGVLEGDEEKCWGFPQFFPATMNILQRVPVHLFCLQRASEHCVYVHHYSAVSVFMEEVCSQTGVPVQQQILLHLGHELPLEANMKIVNLPHTSAQRPLILLSYTPAKNSSLPVTEPESPPIPTKFDVFADYNYTKAMVGVMHQYLRMIEKLHLHRGLLLQGYYSYIMKQRGECREAMNSISKITLRLQSCFNVEQRIHALGSNADSAETTQLHQVHEHLPIYSEGIQKFENRLDQLLIEHAKLSETLANDKSIQKMELLQKKIEEVHSQYRMHRNIGKLSYNDVQIHKFDKLTMNGDIKKVKLLFRDDCLNRYRELLSAAREWSRVLQDVQIRLQDFHSFSTGLLADLELTERKQYKSLDQSIFALHSEKSLHPTGITTRDKDQMVCRMHQLKEEMEVLVRELQSNNTIIENLGAGNSPENEARPFTL